MRPLRSTLLDPCIAPVSTVTCLLALLAGCGRGETATADRPPLPAARQEMVVGAGQDDFVLELNRHRLGMYPINASICETLVRLTPELRVEPWLAKSWEYRGDNTYRFTLRQGVAFHDGRSFDAEAVRYSLIRAARTGIGHSFISEESVRIVDVLLAFPGVVLALVIGFNLLGDGLRDALDPRLYPLPEGSPRA